MTRKLISLFLALCLVLGLFPMSAMAVEDSTESTVLAATQVTLGTTTLNDGESLADGTAVFANGILTLNGYNGHTIVSEKGVLEIRLAKGSTNVVSAGGIKAENLVIIGAGTDAADGRLTIRANNSSTNYGIDATSVRIENAVVDIDALSIANYGFSYGIYAETDIAVYGSTLTVKSTSSASGAYGLYTDSGDICLQGSTVTLTLSAGTLAYGIRNAGAEDSSDLNDIIVNDTDLDIEITGTGGNSYGICCFGTASNPYGRIVLEENADVSIIKSVTDNNRFYGISNSSHTFNDYDGEPDIIVSCSTLNISPDLNTSAAATIGVLSTGNGILFDNSEIKVLADKHAVALKTPEANKDNQSRYGFNIYGGKSVELRTADGSNAVAAIHKGTSDTYSNGVNTIALTDGGKVHITGKDKDSGVIFDGYILIPVHQPFTANSELYYTYVKLNVGETGIQLEDTAAYTYVNNGGNYLEFEYQAKTVGSSTPLKISAPDIPAGIQGKKFTGTIDITGDSNAYHFIHDVVDLVDLSFGSSNFTTNRENVKPAGTAVITVKEKDMFDGYTGNAGQVTIGVGTVAAPLSLTMAESIPAGFQGEKFVSTAALEVSGGFAPYTFSFDANAPKGLSLNSAKQLVYDRAAAQDAGEATLTVTDRLGNKAYVTIDVGAVFGGHADHCICAGAAEGKTGHTTCDAEADQTGWTAITSVDELRAALQNGGKYYLAADIAMPDYVAGPPAQNYGAITIPEGKTVTLCLNDYVLELKKYYINVEGTFNLTDCKANALNRPKYFKKDAQGNWVLTFEEVPGTRIGGGVITGYTYSNSTGAVRNAEKGTFNFYAGHISGNHNGGVYNGSKFNMYGGVISYNRAGNGGGVSFSGAESEFNMYGGLIAYNEAAGAGYGNGGGVYGQEGTFNMYDGAVIRSNTAANNGGGVALTNYDNETVTFNMYGGTIGGDVMGGVSQGNTAASGGGVWFRDTFNMTGGTITGNTAEYGGGVYANFYKSCSIADAAITNNNGGGVYLSQLGTKGCFRLGGKVTFSGNTHGNDEIPADLYIANLDNTTSSGVYFNYENTLAPTSPIQVYFHSPDTAATVYFTNGWGAAGMSGKNPGAYFVCSNPATSAGEYILVEEDRGSLQELQLVKGYTVTFDTKDKGEGVPVQTFLADAANTVQKPADPTAAGWKFEGWYTDANCTTAYDFTAAVSSSFTLYAKWSETVTATLSATEFVYDGTVQVPEVTVVTGDATLREDTDYTVAYSNSNSTEVDTYTVTVNMLNSSDGPFVLTYKIKANDAIEPVVTLSQTEFTYDGTEHKPTVTVTYGNTTLKENTDYYLDWGEDYGQEFIHVGIAKLVTIRMMGNYTGQIDMTFAINPKPLTNATVKLDKTEFTYAALGEKPDITVKDGDTTLIEGTDYTITWPNDRLNAGEKTVTIKGMGNYTGTLTATYTIKPGEVPHPRALDENPEFTYNGSVQTFEISGDAFDRYTITGNKQKNAGTYTVTVSLNNPSNATNYVWKESNGDTADKLFTFTIHKAEVDIPAPDTKVFYYNGSEQEYGITSTDAYTVTGNKQTNAGTYEVIVSLNANYVWADGSTDAKTYSFVINGPLVTKVDEPSADPTVFVYDGNEKVYGITSTNAYTVTGNKQTNAGTYTVTVTLNENYEWANSSENSLTFTFVIQKAEVDIPATDNTEFTYDGEEKTYTIAADSRYTVYDNVQTEAGTYTVTVRLNDADNYQWKDGTTADKTYTFVINEQQSGGEDPGENPGEGGGQQPGEGGGQQPGEGGGQQPGEDPGENPGEGGGQQPGEGGGQQPGEGGGEQPGEDPGENPGENPGEGGGETGGEAPTPIQPSLPIIKPIGGIGGNSGNNKFDHVTMPDDNALSGDIDMSLADIVDATLTEKEQNGTKPIDIELKVKDASETMPASEKKSIDKGAAGDEIVMYLDITLSKQVGNGKEQKISETNAPVKISLQVPAWAINHDPAVNRIYYMLHLHDGVVEHIHGNFDPLTNTFSFETDCFSPYALAYTDVTALGVPKTGSTFPVWACILCMAGLAGMAVCVLSRKRSR